MRLVRKVRWCGLWEQASQSPWRVCGDAFKNAPTEQNALSVFRSESLEQDREVMAAIVSTLEWCDADYCVVDGSVLVKRGFSLVAVPGKTPVASVNELHLDVEELGGEKLLELLDIFIWTGETYSFEAGELGPVIRDWAQSGMLQDEVALKKYRSSWEKKLARPPAAGAPPPGTRC